MSPSRILIVNLTRLGDLLQTSPTIAGLRAAHPGAEISVVAEKNFAEVCDAIPGVDRVHRIDLDRLGRLLLESGDKLTVAFHEVRELVAELREQRFELALNFSSSRMSAVFLGLLGVPDVRGWSMTADGFRLIRHPWSRLFATLCLHRRVACFNLVDCYRGVAGCLGDGPRRLLYEVEPAARAAIGERLDAAGVGADARLVALQLGASREVRRWPGEAFASLVRHLSQSGLRVALIGGPGERALADAVLATAGTDVQSAVDLCGRTTIPELAALLERTHLLVTGDTGPMHMAAAVGTPIVGLFFGPALPFDTGPYGADHVLLHASVACAPCDHAITCLNPFCRTIIDPQLTAQIVHARLAGDWQAIERAARAAPAVRVYRTGFDRHGLYACRSLVASAAQADDLRWAYRATWLGLLEGVPFPEPRDCGVDLAPFAALADLARLGGQLAGRLHAAAIDPVISLALVERLGTEIEALDCAVREHGEIHPDVAVLTQMFKFEKENVQGEDVATLAGEAARLYRDLERSAGRMQALLGGSRADEEMHDASVHQ